MGLPNTLPCICTNPNCGYQFYAPNPVGGSGSNITFTGNKTNCPKCSQTARYADWSTDTQGDFHLHGFFSFIREIKSVETLKNIKTELEAANDQITATELADTLVELDSNFTKFRELVKTIPPGAIKDFIQTLIMILTLVVINQASETSEEHHKETTSILERQQELEQEKFEYKKQRDTLEDKAKQEEELEREKLNSKINALESAFERKLKDLDAKDKQPSKPRNKLKGSDRNKPCPCGSGNKAKKCHPNGFNK